MKLSCRCPSRRYFGSFLAINWPNWPDKVVAGLQQQMVLALTLTLVLTLDLAQITKLPLLNYLFSLLILVIIIVVVLMVIVVVVVVVAVVVTTVVVVHPWH